MESVHGDPNFIVFQERNALADGRADGIDKCHANIYAVH